MRPETEKLAEALLALEDGLLLVVTGAGVSRASGISTFRGPEPDAVWKQSDVSKATFGYFQRDPVGQWLWYLKRFDALGQARPNPAHQALAELERWQLERGGRFLLVTQNIDCLHEEAGSRELIKVHGTSDRLRCSRPGCSLVAPNGSVAREDHAFDSFRDQPSEESLPRCPECGALLRAHVLFFDEYYQDHSDYRFSEVRQAAHEADLALFVGTSFSVGVTDLILNSLAMRQMPSFSIDPAAARAAGWARLRQMPLPAEDLLPELLRRLPRRASEPIPSHDDRPSS